MRCPRMQGRPPHFPASTVIRLRRSRFMKCPSVSAIGKLPCKGKRRASGRLLHHPLFNEHCPLSHAVCCIIPRRGRLEIEVRKIQLREMRGTMKRTFIVLAILPMSVLLITFLAATAPGQTPPPPVISPEVHTDRSVTFRFRAPNDKEVAVQIEGVPKPIPMRKDDQGVWSATTEPLAPDYYGYTIIADGVGLFDPSNHAIKPNFLYRASEVHVPGPASLSWEIGAVPHGEIHHHFYKSGVVGDDRDFYVYTPPGYDPRGK